MEKFAVNERRSTGTEKSFRIGEGHIPGSVGAKEHLDCVVAFLGFFFCGCWSLLLLRGFLFCCSGDQVFGHAGFGHCGDGRGSFVEGWLWKKKKG